MSWFSQGVTAQPLIMETMLVWKTASGKFAPVIDLSGRNKKQVILTTVTELQTGGLIQLFWKTKTGMEPADSIRIKDLPPSIPGRPALIINSAYNGGNRIIIELKSKEKTIQEFFIIVPPPFRARKKNIFPALPLALLISAAAVILVLRFYPFRSVSDPAEESTPAAAHISAAVSNPDEFSASVEAPVKDGASAESYTDSETDKRMKENHTEEQPAPLLPKKPITEKVFFMPEDENLTAEAEVKLETLIPLLQDADLTNLSITGHCALFGTESERQELSLKRAKNTAVFINERLDLPDSVRIIGMGGKKPFSLDRSEQDLNRRVEIELNP